MGDRSFVKMHKIKTKSFGPYSIWKALYNPLEKSLKIVLLIVRQKVKRKMTQNSDLIPKVQVAVLLLVGSGINYTDGIVRLSVIAVRYSRN